MPIEYPNIIADIRWLLEKLPDKRGKEDEVLWSCHALTRASKRLFRLTDWVVVDGFFNKQGICHSWLYSASRKLVLDVYPMSAHGGPLLVDLSPIMSPWRGLYLCAAPDYYQGQRNMFNTDAQQIVYSMKQAVREYLTEK